MLQRFKAKFPMIGRAQQVILLPLYIPQTMLNYKMYCKRYGVSRAVWFTCCFDAANDLPQCRSLIMNSGGAHLGKERASCNSTSVNNTVSVRAAPSSVGSRVDVCIYTRRCLHRLRPIVWSAQVIAIIS